MPYLFRVKSSIFYMSILVDYVKKSNLTANAGVMVWTLLLNSIKALIF